jgi:MFS family permease
VARAERDTGAPPPPAATVRTPILGTLRLRYVPVLVAYFAYGASTITSVALVFLQKDALGLTPAEVAEVSFWVSLPWSMKMVAGAASDAYPILGSRRGGYLLLGALGAAAGYVALATVVTTKSAYLLAMLLVATGFMIQDVVADALSVEIAETEEEVGQVQTLGRMSFLAGTISVGYLGGWLAGRLGARGVMGVALVLPLLVVASLPFVRRQPVTPAAPSGRAALAGAGAPLVMGVGLAYALLGVALNLLAVPRAQEIVLAVSAVLLVLLLRRVGITRAVGVAAFVIFLFRATPSVGQGYSYWAIDRLGFDERFLGLLAQVAAVLSLAGLVVLRRPIVRAPVSATLFWVSIAGAVLYLPNIGLFYGLAEWLGITPRSLALIDTTISAPLTQIAMVPMLVLIAKVAPRGAEATMFAIMASLMNLALSASELFTRWLNDAFGVTQQDYGNLGRLMILVGALSLVPLLVLPWLRRYERQDIDPRPPGDVG